MPHTRQAAQARLDWGGELRVPPTPHARARSQPDRPVLQGDIILLGLRDFQVRCLRRGPRARHRRCVVGSPSDRPARRTKRRTSFRSTTATRRAASKRTASCPTQCKSMRVPRCSTARTLAATTSTSTRTVVTRTEPSRATLRAAHPRPVPRDAAGPGRARRLATAHRPAPICSQGMVRRRHSTRGCL